MRISLVSFALLAALAIPAAQAETITFDALVHDGSYSAIPAGYNGFNFGGFDLIDGAESTSFSALNSNEVAYNSFGYNTSLTSASGLFTLSSLNVDNPNGYALSVTLTGTFAGGGTQSAVFNLAPGTAPLETLNWSGLTSVSFSTPGGNQYFAIDNVTVNPTPEPSSLILLGTGLLGIAGAARRRFAGSRVSLS